MEWLIVFAVIAAFWYYLSENKNSKKERVKTVRYDRFDTPTGYIERKVINEATYSKSNYCSDGTQTANNWVPPSHHATIESAKTHQAKELIPSPRQLNHPIRARTSVSHEHTISPKETSLTSPSSSRSYKECNKCSRSQPHNSFFNSDKQPDGLSKWCKSCHESRKKKPRNIKFCTKCKNNRIKSSFFPSDKQPDGLTKWCKMCHKKLS